MAGRWTYSRIKGQPGKKTKALEALTSLWETQYSAYPKLSLATTDEKADELLSTKKDEEERLRKAEEDEMARRAAETRARWEKRDAEREARKKRIGDAAALQAELRKMGPELKKLLGSGLIAEAEAYTGNPVRLGLGAGTPNGGYRASGYFDDPNEVWVSPGKGYPTRKAASSRIEDIAAALRSSMIHASAEAWLRKQIEEGPERPAEYLCGDGDRLIRAETLSEKPFSCRFSDFDSGKPAEWMPSSEAEIIVAKTEFEDS